MEAEVNAVTDSSISTTWLLIYSAAALLIVHQLYSMTYLWRLGIPGPIPLPILGHYLTFFLGLLPAMEKWSKKYGKHFGMYVGSQPMLMTSDLDLARHILVKDFPSFHSRKEKIQIPYLSDSILMVDGERWKRGRSYMSPTFSGSKMKQLIPGINSRCDALMEVLDKHQKKGESFAAKETFGAYVLDCVACCAFGIDADCQRNPDDPFMKHTVNITAANMKPRNLFRFLFPFLSSTMDRLGFDFLPRESVNFFVQIIDRAMELRKESGGAESKDFLQLMIDAAEAEEDMGQEPANGINEEDKEPNGRVIKKKKIPLTTKELIGQSLIFFFAGYDTVSRTLSFLAYALATNPDVQKRLQEEIDEMVTVGKPIAYDTVFKMEYLDKVWCESLRRWPIAFALKRVCTQDFNYQGLTIPNGMQTFVNVWDIHHNPELWSEPNKFDPENFTKEARESRHPCAFLPFGAGPRNCVGMRFAILESKIAIIRILQKYTLEITPDTPDLNDTANLDSMGLYPKKGIHVRLLPRE